MAKKEKTDNEDFDFSDIVSSNSKQGSDEFDFTDIVEVKKKEPTQSSFLGGALGSPKPNQVVQPNVGVPNPNRNVQSSNLGLNNKFSKFKNVPFEEQNLGDRILGATPESVEKLKQYEKNKNEAIVSKQSLLDYEQSQLQYKAADEELKNHSTSNAITNEDGDVVWDFGESSSKVAEHQRLGKNRNHVRAIADKKREAANPYIDKEVDYLYGKYGKDLIQIAATGIETPNSDLIQTATKSRLKELGIPENGVVYQMIKTKLAGKAQFEKIKPEVNDKFKKIFEQENKTSLDEAQKSDFEKFAIKIPEIKKQTKLTLSQLKNSIESETKQKANEYSNLYKQGVSQVNQQAASDEDVLKVQNSIVAELQAQQQQLVNSGQTSVEEANKYLQSPEVNKLISDKTNEIVQQKYGKTYVSLYDNYLNSMNEINKKSQSRYKRQQEEILNVANAEINGIIEKAKKDYKVSPQLQAKMESAYKKAYSEVTDKNRSLDLKNIKESTLTYNLTTSTLSALGQAITGFGNTFDMPDMADIGERMDNFFSTPTEGMKKWSDVLDPTKLTVSTGNLIGRMAPSIGATALTAYTTRNAALTTRVAAATLAGWYGETADMVGNTYKDVLAETGDIVQAQEASDKVFKGQVYLLPTYVLESVPFIGDFGKKLLNKVPTIAGKTAVGGAGQLVNEIFQEVPQNAIEEAARNGEELSEIGKYITPKMVKETTLEMSPLVLLGAKAAYTNAVKERNTKNDVSTFLAKNDISEVLGSGAEQFLFNVYREQGSDFTNVLLTTMFTNGKINQDKLSSLQERIAAFNEYKTFAQKAKIDENSIKSQVSFRVYDEYRKAKAELEAEENPEAAIVLSENLKKKKAQFESYFKGDGVDLVSLKLSNGEEYVLNYEEFEQALEKENVASDIAKGKISMAMYASKDSESQSFKNIKKKLNELYKANQAAPSETNPSGDRDVRSEDKGEETTDGLPTESTTEPIRGQENAPFSPLKVSDEEYKDFIDNGNVSEQRIISIADKVKNREQLTDRETEIFTDKTSEINKVIAAQPLDEEIDSSKPTPSEALNDVESTTNALNDWRNENIGDIMNPIDKQSREKYFELAKDAADILNFQGSVGMDKISEAYHKAKADNTNNDFVKAVEGLLGNKEVKVEEIVVEKPTFANVPILTRTAEEIETAKNEVFNNLNKLEVGSVIENSDGKIKVVTEKSTDKKGNILIGVVTYERQEDGSLRQMTNPVWAKKSADGKIKLDYNPHSTGTNSKGERVTVTDQITDKKIDLSKENIFTTDENGNLIQINKVEKPSVDKSSTDETKPINPKLQKAKEELEKAKAKKKAAESETTKEEVVQPKVETPKVESVVAEDGVGANKEEYKESGVVEGVFKNPVNGTIRGVISPNSEYAKNAVWKIENNNGRYYVSGLIEQGAASEVSSLQSTLIEPLFSEDNIMKGKRAEKIFVIKPAELQKNSDGTFTVIKKGLIRYDNLQSLQQPSNVTETTTKAQKVENTTNNVISSAVVEGQKLKDPTLSAAEKKKAKVELGKILANNPSVKRIFDNIKEVHKQLVKNNVITKEGDCP